MNHAEIATYRDVEDESNKRDSALVPHVDAHIISITADKWGERYITPSHTFVPIPAYLGEGWLPNWDAIPARTPKDEIREARNEQTGALMYKFVTTGYVVRTLNKVARGLNWGYEIIEDVHVNAKDNGDFEHMIKLQIVMPGMFRPVMGVGSSKFQTANKQDTWAKTAAGALTAALKNAAKQMGIGRDLDEDDPEFNKVLDNRTRTIDTMFNKLVERGEGDAAKEIIRRVAPTALLENGTLLAGQIEFELLEGVQRDLSALATRIATKAAGTEAKAT